MSNDRATTMDSVPSVFITPTDPLRPQSARRGRRDPRGASVALLFSIVVHLGLALLAARHLRANSIAAEPTRPPLELLATDIDVLAEADDAQAMPVQKELVAGAARLAAPRAVARRVSQATAERTNAAVSAPEPEPALVSAAPEARSLHFTMTAPKPSFAASGNVLSSQKTASVADGSNAPVSAAGVDTPAQLRAGNVPTYTARALEAGIEANVPLEIVVSETGIVTSARVLAHVGYGLDEVARRSVLGYRFAPALRSGKAVAVRMHWLMRFQLR